MNKNLLRPAVPNISPSQYAVSTMSYLFLQLAMENPISDPIKDPLFTFNDDTLRKNIRGELSLLFTALDDHPEDAELFIECLNEELDGGCYREVDEFFTGWFYANLIDSVKCLASEEMAAKIISSFGWMKIEGEDN